MLSKYCEFTVICLLFGAAFSEISVDNLNNLTNHLEANINDIMDLDLEKTLEKSGVDLSHFNRTTIDPEKVENVLRDKCEKYNSSDAVDALKNEQETVVKCITQHINATEVQEELDESKKTGSMDEVFGKYCKKWPIVYNCFDNATVTVRRCMSAKEVKAFNKTLDVIQEFQEFMCHKDGDRLAMFVAEGGVECIQEQKGGIEKCLNTTIGARLPEGDDLSVANLQMFSFDDDNCQVFDELRSCVNKVLEKCQDTTPANIVDAAFKFLKKQFPCNETEKPSVTSRVEASALPSANSAYSVMASLYSTIGYVLLVKIFSF